MHHQLDHFGLGGSGDSSFGRGRIGSFGHNRNRQMADIFEQLHNMPFLPMSDNLFLRRSGMGGFVFGRGGVDPDNMTYDQLLQMFPNVPRGADETAIQALPTDEYKAPSSNGNGNNSHSNSNSNSNSSNDNESKSNDDRKNKKSKPKVEKCSICLEEFKNGESIRRLPCLHIFHTDEIDRWLRTNHICPICRIPIDERQNQHQRGQEEEIESN